MANTIRIKRRQTGSAGAPVNLASAELAFNEVDGTLYYGKGGNASAADSVIAIAGSGAFVDVFSNQVIDGDKTFVATLNANNLAIQNVAVTASAPDLNKIAGVTDGVASPSKALVVDANKDLDLDGGDLTAQNIIVEGDLSVRGTTTTINSVDLVVKDKLIEIAAVDSPTDVTANGGGFRVKGATNKDFKWSNTSGAFTSSEHMDLASGKKYHINGAEVLSSTALGSSVVSSSLTSVGVISSGEWQGTSIAIAHGGTGADNEQDAINALTQVSQANTGQVLTKNGNGDAVWADNNPDGITELNGSTASSQSFNTGMDGSDFNISTLSESGAHIFNLPDAGASARGAVNTGSQTFAGAKTFANNLTVSASNVNLTLHNTEGGRDASFALFNNKMYLTRSGGNLGGNWALTIDMEDHLVGINRYTPGAQLHVGTHSSSEKGLVVTGKPGQTANLFELQNSDEEALFKVNPSGAVKAGAWEGDVVDIAYGGSGANNEQDAINNLSQVAGASAGQVLTKVGSDAVWATPADTGISSLNGLSGDSQTFAIGTDASQEVPYWSSSGSVHTLNLPYATNAVRGLVSNSNQLFGGRKAFLDGATVGEGSGIGGVFDVYNTGSAPAVLIKKGNGASGEAIKFIDHSGASVFVVDASGAITTGSWSGSTIAVANGGTGATTVLGAQQNLGVEPGVDVQAYSDKLQALVDLSGSFASGVIKLVGYSDGETAEYVDTTAFSRSLLDDASASAARTTLELVPGVDVMAYDSELAALAGLVSAADKLPYFTGSGTASLADFSSFGRSLVDDASASDARTTLGLGSMAVQSSSSVSISGGSIDNVVFDGGTY